MSVLTFAVNDLFVARIKKNHVSNPSRSWQNSYEFVANSAGSLSDLAAMADTLLNFEAQIHNTFTHFEQVTVSTWAADSKPYDPDAFLTLPVSLNGLRDTTGELEPLNVCWSVSRSAFSGRAGHVFFRGVLAQADTQAPSGILQLTDPSAMSALLSDARIDSSLTGYLGTAPEAPLSMALINKNGTNIRTVQTLTSVGVSLLPVDHAWFNRTSP